MALAQSYRPFQLADMVRRLLSCVLLGAALPLAAPAQAAHGADSARRDLVVLLHGMGRTAWSMQPMEEPLRAAGFDVLRIGYSSWCCGIAELGQRVREELAARRGPQHETVHFVGHSLGGIIARWILAQDSVPAGVGRLVMLAPPNQGARLADRYAPFIDWLLEPIDELRTDSGATVRQLPPPRGVAVGVIAARDDGKLSVDETHVNGEAGHVVVGGSHTFIMRRDDVHRLTIEFLRTGRFPTTGIESP